MQLNDDLLRRLDDFIRKYYKNLLLRGLLRCLILLIALFLLLTLFEYLEYSSSEVRTLLFYSYLGVVALVLGVWVVPPAARLLSIGKRLTYFQAARIIGDHFPEVKDKLLNLLQLKQLSANENSDLLLASIEQRTSQLSFVPFHKAIDKRKLKKVGVIASVVVAVLLLVGLIFPSFISQPTFRYINHSEYFAKPAPFEFILQNRSLSVLQQEDYEVKVKTQGAALPEQVDIRVEGQSYKMRKEAKNLFSYTIRQINRSTKISFHAAEVESQDYIIEVKPKPVLVSLDLKVIYPSYTRMESKTLSAANRFSLPKGSTLVWTAQTRDTRELLFDFAGSKVELKPNKRGEVEYSQRVFSSMEVVVRTKNEYTSHSDSLQFSITSIEDAYPQIAVLEQKDSLLPKRVVFRGQIRDDYGFNKLDFVVRRPKGVDEQPETLHTESLEVSQTDNVQEFYHYFDLSALGLQMGDRIEYYFEVWDNDGVNGSKSARSEVFVLKMLSSQELEQIQEKNSQDLKTEAQDVLSEIKKLQKQIEELNRKLVEKKELSWQEKKQVEELAERQRALEEKLREIKEKLSENNKIEEQFPSQDEEILEKQRELEELFEKVLDEDMKEMIEQIQKLTQEQIDKDKLNEALKQIKLSNEDVSKQLDRNLEMFKRLEAEKKAGEIVEDLKELSKKQEELAKSQKDKSQEEILQEQKKLSQEFKQQQEKLSELQKEMKALQQPQDLKRNPEREQSIEQKQKSAEQNTERNRKKQASEDMKQAAEQMQQMAQELQESMEESEQEQLGEDIEQVRAMLKNLVRLSMQQEELIARTKATRVSDAGYQDIIRRQHNIKEDMKMINDSLFAMSKRQRQVGDMINQELNKINDYLERSQESMLRYNQVHYSQYKNNSAASSQQYAMTSMNNLALMLSESLENMKQQQQQSKQSKGKPQQQCSNPSQSPKQSSQQSMRELQEALNKELERLQKELEKQKNQGTPKIGEGAKLNEQLAKAAAQQERIRKMVQQAAEESKRNGGKPNKKMQEMQRQMEQTEKEIVNKTISRKTINRQAEILTRMLESERAEKQKEKDRERRSKEGKDRTNKQKPEAFPEFEKLKDRELELFRQIPPIYSPFYKKKVNDYFYGSKKQGE